MTPHRRHSAAFTLIEVLVAIAMIAVVLPVAMQGVSVVMQLGADARHRAEAATLAQSKLEELAATSDWQSGMMSGDFGTSHPGYRWVATAAGWVDGNMTELSVEVSWASRARTKSVVIGTLVSTEAQ